MSRRIFAFFCTLALLVGLLPAGTVTIASAESTSQYQVGYAIRNISPWVSSSFVADAFETDKNGKITGVKVGADGVPTVLGTLGEDTFTGYSSSNNMIYPYLCSLVGNQVDWKSIMQTVYDDSGDGEYNDEDGIFATCTAVTYGEGTADQKTVLFITVDAMKAWDALVTRVRKDIVAAFGEEYGIQIDQIMVSSNHTHSGPSLTDYMGNGYVDTTIFNTDQKKAALKNDRHSYYEYVVKQIVAAAEDSLKDRAAATMTRGSVNATEATAELNYNGGEGYRMNTIRHYEKTVANGFRLSAFSNLQSASYIHANSSMNNDRLETALSASGVKYFEAGTVTTDLLDEPDNTMYVLRFSFDDGREPVVFVNWRAHSTMNSGIDRNALSSDYANGLRTVLKEQFNCRAAFFLGAAGNVVPSPTSAVYTSSKGLIKEKMDWLYEASNKSASSLKIDSSKQTFVYGKLLAEIANYCLDNCMTDPLPAGEIKNYQCAWSANKQKYSEIQKKAALAMYDEVTSDMTAASYTGSIDQYLSEKSIYFPYLYKDSETGEITFINSRLHYKSVYSQAKASSVADKVGAVELNAIMLGDSVAFVTSPNELVDYYNDFSDYTGDMLSQQEINELNDWYELISDKYGMPFVLAYSNQSSGYIANWLDFNTNSERFYEITGKGQQGHMIYTPGTYESLTSAFAMGEGEALIDVYKRMLGVVAGEYDKKAPCPYCSPNEDVTWKPLFADNAADTNWVGHHYLYEDLENSACRTINAGDKLCLDLNGKTISAKNRAFNTNESAAPTNAVVNIMDSVGTGKVIGNHASNNPYGGAIKFLGSTNTLNIYGGTFSFNNIEGEYEAAVNHGTGRGGVVALTGKLNLYGGTIQGAAMKDISARSGFSDYTGLGGAVFVNSGGQLNVYGGSITSGSVPAAGAGPCVYLNTTTSKICLSGNGNVDDIYCRNYSTSLVTVSGTYTGSTNLSFHKDINLTNGKQVGVAKNANIDDAEFTIVGNKANSALRVFVDNNKLILSTPKAMIGDTVYKSLQDAINAYDGTMIKMVDNESTNATVAKGDVYLDLNGCNITGKVTTAGNYTLYCKDSATDDYTVADGKYGKLLSANGNVVGIPEESELAEDGYLKVTETDGISFHCVNLRINAMTLRPAETGVYYKCDFACDEIAAKQVSKFGIAMSVKDAPALENLNTDCILSDLDGFKAGGVNSDLVGTVLTGVMKQNNSDDVNEANANLPVYGRAYLQLSDGTYLFGAAIKRSFREQVELVDAMFATLSDVQKTAAMDMYKTYGNVMKSWDISNMKAELR